MTEMQYERVDLKPLNRAEMDMAQKLIDKEHPLKDIPIWVTLPFLKSVKKWLPKCMLCEPEEDTVPI